MLTTMVDQSSRDQTPACSSPLQARALHLFRKIALGGRKTGRRKSLDNAPPVAIPTQDFQRARSSIDFLRKPDVTRLIGFRVESGSNPMNPDDSSQDASPSGNSPYLQAWRPFPLESLRNPALHSTFTGHGAAPLFFRDQAGAGNQILDEHLVNLLAPAPLFLRSTASLIQPSRYPGSSPEVPSQISLFPQLEPDEEAMPNNDTPQPLGDVLLNNDALTNAPADLTPTTPSGTMTRPRAKSLPFPRNLTLETVEERSALLPNHSAPLPPRFRCETERGLRLSPTIITTRPIPLLNLPALPPLPPVQDTPLSERARLKSVPLLSRHGLSITEGESDHENATLGDSDEEDGDEGGEEEFVDAMSLHESDDEDEDPPSAGPSNTQEPKSSQKQPIKKDECSVKSPVFPMPPPVGSNHADYFCSKTHVRTTHVPSSSTFLEMHPLSANIPSVEEVPQRRVLDPDLSTPGPRLQNKPSLYHAASRSMLNLGSTRRSEWSMRSRETSNPVPVSARLTESHEGSEESDSEAIGRLLRRTSMPSFHPTSDPPPYPTFGPRPKESRVTPREDEGRERLPPYSNSLYLMAIMPRKMEFSSPGVQAKDRKWRRVVCELEGTTFRVYKCPPGASGAGALGDWWEKHVGVGDMANPNPPRARKKDPEEQLDRPTKLINEAPSPVIMFTSSQSVPVSPERQRTRSQSSMATQTTVISTPRHAKRASAASFLSPFRGSSSGRPDLSVGESSQRQSRELELLPVDVHDSRSSLSHESTGRGTPVTPRSTAPSRPRSASRLTFLPVVTGRPSWRDGEIRKPLQSDVLRAYTLQHAESGLGNDYLKRKNVIRVRMEGEQFLLQAPDIPAVVEWIEGLHAGINIALDIDERPMPRGPMFPRRRRRRLQRTQEDTSGQQPS